jgi:hypothetical protein
VGTGEIEAQKPTSELAAVELAPSNAEAAGDAAGDPTDDPTGDPAGDTATEPSELGPPMGEIVEPTPGRSTTRELEEQVTMSTPTQEFGPSTRIAMAIDDLASIDPAARSAAVRGGNDPLAAAMAVLSEEIDRGAPAGESVEDRVKRRVKRLLELGAAAAEIEDLDRAVLAIEMAMIEAPDSAAAQKLIYRARDAILNAYQRYVGDLGCRPRLALGLHEMSTRTIDSRAAFLLTRVDGNMTFEEILDVSGMPRLEAFRYLVALVMRGVLSIVE